MIGYTLTAKAGADIASNIFFQLSGIAFSKSCKVRLETGARATSEKILTINVRGDEEEVSRTLSETRAYLNGASDVLQVTEGSGCRLEVELNVV